MLQFVCTVRIVYRAPCAIIIVHRVQLMPRTVRH